VAPWSIADLAPGLAAAAVAGLGGWTLHRFYDRVGAAVFTAFAALLALSFWPVLVGGDLLLPLDSLRSYPPWTGLAPTTPHGNPLQGDLIELTAPAQAAVRRALAAGRWPLWSAETGAGMPLLADPQAQALSPLVLPALPLGAARGAGVTAALRVYCALLFTFLLLRRNGLGAGPALAGAVAWGLGGFLMLWLGWPLATSGALLPALLYGAARVVDLGGRRDVLLLAAAAAGLLLAGHPETALYAFLLAAAFTAHRLARRRADGARVGAPGWRSVGGAGGALLLGAALAAPAVLPTALYLPQTLRAARLAEPPPPPPVAAAGERAAKRLVPLVAPQSFGNDRYAAYWGGENVNEDASGFVGGALLVAALLALAGLGRRADRLPQERLMAAALGLSLIVVALPPGLPGLLARLPGGAASGYQHRLLMVAGFALAYLGAGELERRRRGRGSRWGPVVAAAAVAAVVVWAWRSFPDPADPGRLAVLRFGWVHWHLRFLAATALALAVGRGRRWTAYAVAALAAGELLLLHLPANPPMPKRLDFPAPAPVDFLRRHLDAGRGERFAGVGGAMLPNLGALYGLADARLYSPMAPAPYLAATAPLITGWSAEVPAFGRPAHPLYDLLGVRYVVAPAGTAPPPGLTVALADPAAAVWRRPRALPRLFLPAAAAPQGADWPQRLAALADCRERALVAAIPGGAGGWRAAAPGAGAVEITALAPARIAARERAPEVRLLATSIYQDGGWRLLVDGRRRPLTRSDGPFVAAWLPPGEHALDLLYRPGAFVLGCLAAACGLALGTAWLLPPPRG
jgi:hypothetical protein